uniref:Uncharacterized protein n=1 Tax=Oncorhynchus tshawytscha TaxID=74940 RepID=A0A8C8GZU0_ONCTS
MDNTSSSGPSKGGASPEYSNTEFVAGMSPLSPYLNVDPIYFTHVSSNLNIAFFTIGGCCITCEILFLPLLPLFLPLPSHSRTKDMAWSKPRNVQLLNLVTFQGATWANTLGSLGEYNVAAGIMTGMLYTSTENTNLGLSGLVDQESLMVYLNG